MKRKGFTLIELLAVIIVLAIIALIAVPMVLNTIEKSKEGALKGSAYGVIEAATLYYARNAETPEIKEFVLKDGTFKAGEETLEIKGEVKGTGSVIIDKQGVITLCINDDKRYAYKSYNTDVVSVGTGDTCKIEENILTNKYVAYLTGEDGSSSLDSYYTKEEVENYVAEEVSKALANYATNEAVGTALQSYATKSDLDNYYTKTETESKVKPISRTDLTSSATVLNLTTTHTDVNKNITLSDSITNYTYIEIQYDLYTSEYSGYYGENTMLIPVSDIVYYNSNTPNWANSSTYDINISWFGGITAHATFWFKDAKTIHINQVSTNYSQTTKMRIKKIVGVK